MNRKRLSLRKRFGKVHRPIGGFNNAKTVALRYVDTISLNPGTSSVATNVWRMNSLYDPDYTGTGHQPMFFDNYAALYQRYRVNYATITMVALDNHIVNTTVADTTSGTTTGHTFYASANERACRMFILRDDEVNDFPTNIDNLIEEGNTNFTWKYVPANTAGKVQKISMIGYPRSLLKCPYNDLGLTADVTGNPQKECYFITGVASFPNADANAMSFQVIITYNVTFSDLKKNQTQN